MLLPVPEIFIDDEITGLSIEINALEAELKDLQRHTETEDEANALLVKNARDLDIQIPRLEAELDARIKDGAAEHHNLELLLRSIAQLNREIEARQTQQGNLDALVHRFDADCLKAEDRLDELQILRNCSRNELEVWAAAEKQRKDRQNLARKETAEICKEAAKLARDLESASQLAAAASEEADHQKSVATTAELQLQGSLSALTAVEQDIAEVRRQLDETECIVAARNYEIDAEKEKIVNLQLDLERADTQMLQTREELDAERLAGGALEQTAAEEERKSSIEEAKASEQETAAKHAQQAQQDAHVVLQRTTADAARAASAVQNVQLRAEQAARNLAVAMKQQDAIQTAIKQQEDGGKTDEEQHIAISEFAAQQREQAAEMNRNVANLGRKTVKMQQEIDVLKSLCAQRGMELSQARAQHVTLLSRAAGLKTQLEHHQENLYRVDYQLLLAQRAATVFSSSSSPRKASLSFDENMATLRSLRQQVEIADASQRKLAQECRNTEEKARRAAAAADLVQKKVATMHEQRINEETAIDALQKDVKSALKVRGDVKLAVDRAALDVARSKQRLIAGARAVVQTSAAAAEKEVSYTSGILQLQTHLKELESDHHVVKTALQHSKKELATKVVQGVRAEAVLNTLQLKNRGYGGFKGEKDVSDVCAAMQREVEDLQAALAAAEADFDVLEKALAAQQVATASSRKHIKYGDGGDGGSSEISAS